MSGDAHQDAQERQGADAPAGVASVPVVDAAAVQEGHYPEPHGKDWWCAECLQVLDGEDGGCDAVLLAREVVALREERDWFKGEMEQFMRAASANHARAALLEGLLHDVEWGGIQMDRALDDSRLLLERACPSCGHGQSKSHRPACRLAAALADGGRG